MNGKDLTRLGEDMCEFISTEFPEATVTCRHLPDPSVIPGGFQPLPPYFAFVVKLKFPVKDVSVGFSSGPWLRDATSFESIRRLMEKHQWKQRVEEATDGQVVEVTDEGVFIV